MKCLECNVDFSGQKQSGKKLSAHLRSVHNLTVDEYVIKHFCDGIKPECPMCGETPRRVGFKFRTYCKTHASEASIAGGKKGGRAPAWNKGKTKKTDARVGALAEKMTGVDNPFFGRRHTEESLMLMRKQRRISCDEFEQRSGSLLKRGVIVLASYDDYQSRQSQYLDIKCAVCNHVDKKTLHNLSATSPTTITSMTYTPPAGTYNVMFEAEIQGGGNADMLWQVYKDAVAVGNSRRRSMSNGAYGSISVQTQITVTGVEVITVKGWVNTSDVDIRGRSVTFTRVTAL